MAEGYTVIGVVPSQRLQGGTTIIETIEATAVTTDHEVSISASVDKVGDWRAALAAALQAEADSVESVFDL